MPYLLCFFCTHFTLTIYEDPTFLRKLMVTDHDVPPGGGTAFAQRQLETYPRQRTARDGCKRSRYLPRRLLYVRTVPPRWRFHQRRGRSVPYRLDNGQFELTYDFNTENSAQVRIPQQFTAHITEAEFSLQSPSAGEQTWKRLSEETTPLTGTWRFAARVDEDGNEGERRRPGARMTIKILAGGRFQWAAFNYDTKEFRGTGGGTYAVKDNTYTERIEFFSRDDRRVGSSLSFQYRRTGDDWYHKGQNSQGEPLHEVWTLMK